MPRNMSMESMRERKKAGLAAFIKGLCTAKIHTNQGCPIPYIGEFLRNQELVIRDLEAVRPNSKFLIPNSSRPDCQIQKVLIFTPNHANMKLLKLTALCSFLFVALLTVSCEPESELKKVNVFTKSDLIMTGAQNRPVSTSTGSGLLSVTYDKRTRHLNYIISWFGLTGAPTGIHMYGPAPEGYMAFTPALAPAGPLFSASVTGLTASGTISGSIFVDGVVIKEQTLLNYLYYFSIRTAAWPGGEIRTQVKFQ
jgi:hypothetical protein